MRIQLSSALLCLWATAGVVACSGEDETSKSSACNELLNDGPTATVTLPPAPDPNIALATFDGTIPDGLYELTRATFSPAQGTQVPTLEIKGVLHISGNTLQQVGSINGEEHRYTSTYSVRSGTITVTDTCPTAETNYHEVGFSMDLTTFQPVAPLTLVIRQRSAQGTLELSHERR